MKGIHDFGMMKTISVPLSVFCLLFVFLFFSFSFDLKIFDEKMTIAMMHYYAPSRDHVPLLAYYFGFYEKDLALDHCCCCAVLLLSFL